MAPLRSDVPLSSVNSALNLRIVSALVLAPPVIGAIYLGSPYFDIMVALAAGILAWEWTKIWPYRRAGRNELLVFAGVLWLAIGAMALSRPVIAVAVLGAGTGLIFFLSGRRVWYSAGTLYLGLPCLAMLWLRNEPDFGFELVLWIFAIVWSSDIGAFAAGKMIGGPKLMPRVSPNKTWAGFFGGLAAATACGVIAATALGSTKGLWLVMSESAVIGLCGQGGDLFESWIKRRLEVKDTSVLIPGHGGLMDRIDALMAAAIATALMMILTRSTILPWL